MLLLLLLLQEEALAWACYRQVVQTNGIHQEQGGEAGGKRKGAAGTDSVRVLQVLVVCYYSVRVLQVLIV
jgi:hypothetical protein